MPEETPFVPYEVPGVGTVLDPEGIAGYRVLLLNGEVQAFPAASGEPSEANAAADLAAALATPPDPGPGPAWEEFLDGYITDDVTGFELKANIAACNRFAAMETLLKSAVEHGVLTDESMVSIWDRSNVEHALTVAACRALLLRYGIAWQTAFNALAP